MIEETQGIILRTIRYSESSLIVHWLTEDHGRISTMVRGALKPKSSFRGKLDLFYVCQLSFQRSTRSTLHNLREINLKETFERLRHDVEKINQASYVAQLTSKSIEEDTPVEGLFDLLITFLSGLSQSRKPDLLLVLWFEFRLLQLLGLEPQWRQDRLSQSAKRVIESWSSDDRTAQSNDVSAMATIGLDLFRYLGRFMTYHLGLPPKLRGQLMDALPLPRRPDQEAEKKRNREQA